MVILMTMMVAMIITVFLTATVMGLVAMAI